MMVAMLSCASDSPEERGTGKKEAVLTINLHMNQAESKKHSRATSDDDYSFEVPSDPYESGVRTLRVIIVSIDRDMLVEYNYSYNLENINCDINDLPDLRYKVKAGENKRIFLVANEYMLPKATQDLLASATRSYRMPEAIFNIVMEGGDNNVVVDNSESAATKKFLPMSEFFDYYIPAPKSDDDEEYKADFFMTRALSTFRFSIESVADSYVNGFKIKRIEINNVANSSYLFPHATVYSPDKYSASANPLEGRIITAFQTPSSAKSSPIVFTPSAFGWNGIEQTGMSEQYIPRMYFPETSAPSGGSYYVTVTLEIAGVEQVCGPTPLPNLDALPRNTIVDIRLNFDSADLQLVATLTPYFKVSLFPKFGFDDIIYHPDSYDNMDENGNKLPGGDIVIDGRE